ncbi:MAG: efflux RND transporter permease subunit [Pseudomonadota bacterium]
MMRDNIEKAAGGLIAWFTNNSVAANLLMLLIFFSAWVIYDDILKQTTPEFELDIVQVVVPYPGAAPQEVEQGVIIKIEEALTDVPGIDDINSVASEGVGTVSIEVSTGVDIDQVQGDVKTRVDAISTFPELAEEPVIQTFEIPVPVIFLSVYGDLDEYARKEIAGDIKDGLLELPGIENIEYLGDRDYEISIEVSEQTLRRYDLSMTEIAQAIRNAARDIPGGTIETAGGDILVRTQGQVYTGQQYGDLTLRTFADGTRLSLKDIASINDGFVDNDGFGLFNRQPVATMRVLAGGRQNELESAELVRNFVAEFRERLPASVTIDTWVDRSVYLEQRLDLMKRNLMQGALLVFIVLTLFLRFKFALWVVVGIPVSFCGAIALMSFTPWPVTINVISIFGFILVLGIVVDDAIIIGESIYTTVRAEGHSIPNVIAGTKRVAVTATFGVLTTIAAFAPMLFLGGPAGAFFEAVAAVVILCLLFSLIESKLILPSHLAHTTLAPVDEALIFSGYNGLNVFQRVGRFLQRVQRRTQHGLQWLIHRVYLPVLRRALASQGATFATFIGVLIVMFGTLFSGVVKISLFPEVPGEYVSMDVTMQNGTPTSVRNDALLRIEQVLFDVRDAYLRDNEGAVDPIKYAATFTGSVTQGTMIVEMPMAEKQSITANELTAMWRDAVPEIPGVRQISFGDGGGFGGGPPISFAFTGENIGALEGAAGELASELKAYNGLFDVQNSASAAGDEIQLQIKPAAEALGITLSSLGTQVRQAFFGEEAQRIQRGSDELRVMVRYPKAERRSIADLEAMLIAAPDGSRVPFAQVAEVTYGKAYSSITRTNGKRTVTVSSDLDTAVIQSGVVVEDVRSNVVPDILRDYSGVEYALEGASQDEQEFIANFLTAFAVAVVLIYILIAIPLRSYLQPIVVMSAIPFGLVGAILGHMIMGKAISMFSLFGFIALAGVVVNDSLVMIDFINKARARGVPIIDAVTQSGVARFRAIILTSVTTAVGLMPILFEKSSQAQFVIPMAISLSFGILFATFISLILIPVLYVMLHRFVVRTTRGWRWLIGRSPIYATALEGDSQWSSDSTRQTPRR